MHRQHSKTPQHYQCPEAVHGKAPLEAVSIDILGELVHTARGLRYLFFITECFTELIRTVPHRVVTAAQVAKHFVKTGYFHTDHPSNRMLITDVSTTQDSSRTSARFSTWTTRSRRRTTSIRIDRWNDSFWLYFLLFEHIPETGISTRQHWCTPIAANRRTLLLYHRSS